MLSTILIAAILHLPTCADADDFWKNLLTELGSEAAADVTLHIDSTGLEKALRSPIPDELEKSAAEYDKQIIAAATGEPDEAQVKRVDRIVDSLVGQMHNKKGPFTMRLIKTAEVNAFTTGANYVYVYSALMDQAQDDDELAGILAHELAHVDAGHIGRAQKQGLWIGLGTVAANAFFKGADREKVKDGHAAANATFSREHETEADVLGVLYALRSGYKARGILSFFDRQMLAEAQRRDQLLQEARKAEATLKGLKTKLTQAEQVRKQSFFGMDGGRYEAARVAYNDYIPKYNAFITEAKEALRRPSPWMIDHPFDKFRKSKIEALVDYLERRIDRKDITEPIIIKVLESIEKVEGKSI